MKNKGLRHLCFSRIDENYTIVSENYANIYRLISSPVWGNRWKCFIIKDEFNYQTDKSIGGEYCRLRDIKNDLINGKLI